MASFMLYSRRLPLPGSPKVFIISSVRGVRMSRKTLVALLAVMLFGAAFAAPAHAQSQAVSLDIGYLWVRGLDGRATGDVLVADLAGTSTVVGTELSDALLFDFNHFNNVTFGGEWLIALGDFLEGGVGVGYYSSSVNSVYANFTNQTNPSVETEIPQTLRLRVVPITATVRFLPLGRKAPVEPYIGGGLGIYAWRYSEVGQFVDPTTADIYSASFVGSGWNVGPVIVGGVRLPFGKYALGGEVRWQKATGNLSTNDFVAPKIDLGGTTVQATFVVRFGGR